MTSVRPEGSAQRGVAGAGARLGVLALAASLTLLACTDSGRNHRKVDAVAWVGDDAVTTDAFARELAWAKRTSGETAPSSDEDLAAFRKSTLEDYLERTVVLGAAKAAGVSVPNERVERELLRLKAEYHGKSFDEALAETQQSTQELQERIREQLTIEKYFVEHVFTRVAVTDADVEAWYKDHADDFAQPETVRAAQIVVRTSDEAKRVLAEIRKGMAFDAAARRYSLSPDGKVGGDLGYFRKGAMPAVFDTCFALQKGAMSDVVASDYGFHLFKVLDRKPAEVRTLASARQEIEKKLLRERQTEAQQKAVAELMKKANVRIDDAMLANVK